MIRTPTPKKLFLTYLCVTIVAVVVVGLYGSYSVRRFYLDQTAKDLEARARLCAGQILELMQHDQLEQVDVFCKRLGQKVETRITVIRPDGVVVGDTQKNPHKMENHKNRPEIRRAMQSDDGVGKSTRFSTAVEQHLMYVAVVLPQDELPMVVVRMSIPVTTIKRRLTLVDQNLILAGIAAVILITAVSPWLSFRMGKPEPENQQPDPDSEVEQADQAEV